MTDRDFKIHGFYWVLILSSCLIFQTVYDWSKIANVPELIAFAVGLTSLVLAVIAIVQNFLSGPNMSASIAAVNLAASSVSEATTKMKESAESVLSRLEAFDAIPEGLGDLQEAVTKLSYSQSNTELNTPRHTPPAKAVPVPATIGGMSAQYLLARTALSKNAINVKEATGGVATVSEYISGYLSALRDVNAISYDYEGGAMTKLKVVGGFEADALIGRVVKSTSDYVRARRKSIDSYVETLGEAPPPPQPAKPELKLKAKSMPMEQTGPEAQPQPKTQPGAAPERPEPPTSDVPKPGTPSPKPKST